MVAPFTTDLYLQLRGSPKTHTLEFFDFTGTIYKENSFPAIPPASEIGNSIPWKDGDGFRAGPSEWGAFGLAIELAQSKISSPVIVELGCSQGLWCLPWVKCLSEKALEGVLAVGIEAAPARDEVLEFWGLQQLEMDIKSQLEGIILQGKNWEFNWQNGAVTNRVGFVEFPDIKVGQNNGASIANKMRHNVPRMTSVRTITPSDILEIIESYGYTESIALLHLDLQGEESVLMHDFDFQKLILKSSVIVLGTHSKEIERVAVKIMSKLQKILIQAETCEFAKESQDQLTKDGEQIYVDKELLPQLLKTRKLNKIQSKRKLVRRLHK